MKNTPKIFTLLLILLAACTPLPDRQQELCAYAPHGTAPFALEGEPDQQLSQIITSVMQDTREQHANTPRMRCGTRLSAQSAVDDADIVNAVSNTLGAGWQYQRGTASADIKLHLWYTTSRFSSRQYYALASYQHTLHDAQGRSFRPLQTLYLQNSHSAHGYVVFATIAGAMMLPFVALAYFMRRRRRRQ